MLYAPREQYTSVVGDGSTTSLTANPVGLSLSAGSRYAFGCWAWLNSIAADDYRQIMSLNDGEAIGAGAHIDGIDWIRPGGGSNYAISLYISEADSFEEFQSSTISLTTWYYLFWQRISNTQMQLWINGILNGTLTHSTIGTREAPSRLDYIGVWDTLTEPMNGQIANAKCWWNRNFSAGQIKQEMHSVEPVIADSTLWAWYPFPQGRGRYLDHSGRGHHITQTRGNPGTGPAPTHKLIAPIYKKRLFVLPWARTAGGTTYPISISGSMTATGALIRQAQKVLTGSSTATGALTKQTQKAFTGSSTASGVMSRMTAKAFTGSMTATGALAIIKTAFLTLAGSMSATGALVKQTTKAFAGSSTPSGALAKQTQKSFGGSVTPSGTLTTIKTFIVSVAGSMTATGALLRETRKALLGEMTPSGALTKQTAKAFSGSATPTGTLTSIRTFLITIAGSMTATGELLRQTGKALSGGVTPTGVLTRQTSKALGGSVTPTGDLQQSRLFNIIVGGAMTATGGLLRMVGKWLGGSVSASGAVTIEGGSPIPPAPPEPAPSRGRRFGLRSGPRVGGRSGPRVGPRG